MLKLVTGMPGKTTGFTLIEILVVLLIISIIVTFAMASFGDFGEKRAAIAEAQYFVRYINLVKQEAVLDAVTLSIHINHTGYEVLRFQGPNRWEPVKSALFGHHSFRKRLNVNLTSNKQSMLIISPSGQITPFKLSFGTTTAPNIVIISTQANGSLTVKIP